MSAKRLVIRAAALALPLVLAWTGCARRATPPAAMSSPTPEPVWAATIAGPPPAWNNADAWVGRSIYFVMLDRFANGDPGNDDAHGFAADRSDPTGWWGGDLRGLTQHLDYIQGMGFDAVWITPLYRQNKAGSYHGYWPWDFFAIDGHFGTIEDLHALRRALSDRGMFLMVDVVANHTGDFTYAPANYHEGAAPPFDNPDWFHHRGAIRDYDSQQDLETGEIGGMLDDIDQSNPDAAAALLKSVRWMRETTGADGLRLDTVKHVPREFWRGYVEASGVFCLGEVLHGNTDYVALYQNEIPGLVDFPLYYVIDRVFARGNSMHQLREALRADAKFRRPDLLAPFVDNHDTPRFLGTIGGQTPENLERLRAALAFAFTVRTMPVLYYGTEQTFVGGPDPANREMMRFDADAPLYTYVQRLNALRKAHPALRTGTRVEKAVDHTLYAFERESSGDRALVVLTNSAEPRTFEVPTGFANGTRLVDGLGSGLTIDVRDGKAAGTLPPRGAAVLVE